MIKDKIRGAFFVVSQTLITRLVWVLLLTCALMGHFLNFNRMPLDRLDVLRPAFPDRSELANPFFVRENLRYYLLAADFVPERADLFSLLGYFNYYSGLTQEAIKAYKKSIEIEPRFFATRYNLGLIYYRTGQFEQAISVLKNALMINNDNYLEIIGRSRSVYSFIATEMEKETSENWLTGLRQNIENGYLLLLSSYLKSEEDDKAVHLGLSLIQWEKENPYYNYFVGLALFENDDYARAVHFFSESLRLGLKSKELFEYLTRCWENLGDEQGADRARVLAAIWGGGHSALDEKFQDISLTPF